MWPGRVSFRRDFFAFFETLSKKAKKNENSYLKWELLRGCVVILLKIRAK